MEYSSETLLTNVFNKEERNELIKKMIDFFDSVPRTYICVFEIPNVKSPHEFNIDINENVSLKFTQKEKMTKDQNNVFCEKLIPINTLSIIVKHKGYLSLSDYSVPYGIFKQIITIAMIFGYFRFNVFRLHASNGLFVNFANMVTNYFYEENAVNELDEEHVSMHLSGDITEKLFSLDFNQSCDLEKSLNHIKNIYKSFLNDKQHAARVCAALEWNYDAMFTNNQTVSFIQNCIAIEAIIGEKNDDIGIQKNLQNRCAYMFSTVENRDTVKSNVKTLYDLRSNLVHGTKSRLDKEKDIKVIDFTSCLIKEIIKNEIYLLEKSFPVYTQIEVLKNGQEYKPEHGVFYIQKVNDDMYIYSEVIAQKKLDKKKMKSVNNILKIIEFREHEQSKINKPTHIEKIISACGYGQNIILTSIAK